MEIKQNYIRIDFKDCGLDYDYTIQPWHEVNDYIQSVKDEFECDEIGFKNWSEKGMLPEIKISLIQMTESEYNEWFIKNIEENA